MGRGKGGGALEFVGGPMGVGYGEVLVKGGWESFSKHFTFVVRDGSCILFWHDKWIGDNSLKTLYPQLFLCQPLRKLIFLMF